MLERHAIIFEQLHIRSDAFLLIGREPTPPFAELVGELDLTCHPVHIMPSMACSVKWMRRMRDTSVRLIKLRKAFDRPRPALHWALSGWCIAGFMNHNGAQFGLRNWFLRIAPR